MRIAHGLSMQIRTTKRPQVTSAAASKGPAGARAKEKAGPDSSFAAPKRAPKRAHAVDPAKEFSDPGTKLYFFVALHWTPLTDALKAYDAGHIAPSAAGHSDVVQLSPNQIEAELRTYLDQPDIKEELSSKMNIYEVEERFLRKYNVPSHDDLRARIDERRPVSVSVPHGNEPNPVYAATKQIAEHARGDEKYGALLSKVRGDPLTLVMLAAAAEAYDGPKLKPHEAALFDDLVSLKNAQGQMSPGVAGALRPNIGGWTGPNIVESKLELSGSAERAVAELKRATRLAKSRIESALDGLSLHKPPFGL
jgi:hypothetical protein